MSADVCPEPFVVDRAVNPDTRFMAAYRWVKARAPDWDEVSLFKSATDLAQVRCLHPFRLRQMSLCSEPGGVAKYAAEERYYAKLRGRRFVLKEHEQGYCPVCDRWCPCRPRFMGFTTRRRLASRLLARSMNSPRPTSGGGVAN